ncbi:MAG: PQQ-binding-like beta-propeller repeat protein, partial [Verrucomicrobiota bacterium]|nr:PQQ-binding-like beta-propeller repeat protein [Verrucomicrobiota bacterium]
FNGNARDEADHGHDGTVVGAKLTADRHGKADSAYQFKLGDHIKIKGLMRKPTNLTLSAWFKLEGPQGRLGSEIISLGVSASIRVDSKSNSSQRVGTGGITRMQPKAWMNTLAKFNYTGTGWHQIVFTFDDDADKQVTYVDGVQLALKENERSIVYEGKDKDTVIGIHGRGQTDWRSQGVIDDIRVYDRALSTEEVKALFLREKPAGNLQAGKAIKIVPVAELRAKAQAGDLRAQFQMGLKAINGVDGLKRSPVMAEKWWLRAAKQGHGFAQMNLGVLYSRGGLGEKDPAKAYQWAKLSLTRGNQKAKELVETLEKELMPEQVAQADAFVKAFKPVPENEGEEPPGDEGGAGDGGAEAKELGAIGKSLDIRFTAIDGTRVDLAKMKGKVVLVDFWASWCPPCRVEAPKVKAVHDKLHDKGFEIVGISLDNKREQFDALIKKVGMSWPQYFDGKGWNTPIARRYGIKSIPAMWLVDKEGNLVDKNARKNLESKVEKLLGVKLADTNSSTQPREANATAKPGTVLWAFETKGGVWSSPALGADGTVYVSSSDNRLYALDGVSGAKKWEFKKGLNLMPSSPAIGIDGTVYFGSKNGNVYALDGRTGHEKWKFITEEGAFTSPAIGADGTVYAWSWQGTRQGPVYALDGRTGARKNPFDPFRGIQQHDPEQPQREDGFAVYYSPAIGADGTLYTRLQFTDNIHALDGRTGAWKWKEQPVPELAQGLAEAAEAGGFVGEVFSSPAIGADGTLYVRFQRWIGVDGEIQEPIAQDDPQKLYAVDGKSGAKKWEFATGGEGGVDLPTGSSPVIGPDGTVYIGSIDKKLYAVDGRSGVKKWEFATGGEVISSAAIGDDGTVYIGSRDKKVYALDGKSGARKWELETGGEVVSSPLIGPDGTLYVGSGDSKVYAIKTASGGLAKSPWPMLGQNASRTSSLAAVPPTSPGPAPSYTLLEVYDDQFEQTKAIANVADALAKHPDADALVGDFATPHILDALKKNDKLGKVKVISSGPVSHHRQHKNVLEGIRDGTVHGAVMLEDRREKQREIFFAAGYQAIEVLHELKMGNTGVIPKNKTIALLNSVRPIRRDNVSELLEPKEELLTIRDELRRRKQRERPQPFSFMLIPNLFQADRRRGAQNAAGDSGDQLIPISGKRGGPKTVDEQNNILERLISDMDKGLQRIDGIAINPMDPAGQQELLQKLARKTILITFGTDAPGSGRRVHIGNGHYAAGRLCGRLVKEALPKGGKVIIFSSQKKAPAIDTPPDASLALERQNAKLRHQGLVGELTGIKNTDDPIDPPKAGPDDALKPFVLDPKQHDPGVLKHYQDHADFYQLGKPADIPADLDWQDGSEQKEFASPEAQRGGTFNDFMNGFPRTLRFVGPDANGAFRRHILDNNAITLLMSHPNTDGYYPGLARQWAVSGDGRTVYFRLDPDARYSDGKPVRATDFFYHFYFMRSPHIKAPWYNDYFSDTKFKRITLYDAQTISLTYYKATPDILDKLIIRPVPEHFYGVLDEDYLKDFQWKLEPTTGAYEVKPENVKQGTSITLTRVPGWWADKKKFFRHRFNPDAIKVGLYRQLGLSWAAFLRGELDLQGLSLPDVWYRQLGNEHDLVKRGLIQKVQFYNDIPRPTWALRLNSSKAPLDNREVRVGLHYAMNWDRVLKEFFRGDSERMNTVADGYGPRTHPSLRARGFSVEKAQEHFAKAGFKERGADGILKNADGERLAFTL